IVADRNRDPIPSGVWATARLEAGWNRVLVKIAGTASFALKVVDRTTGAPLGDVEEGDPLGGAEMPALTAVAEPRAYRTPAERALASARGDPAALAVAANLCDDDDRDGDAYRAYESATSTLSGDATPGGGNDALAA